MSIRAVGIVLDAPIKPASDKLTAITLAYWCNDEGGSLYPSMNKIAERIGVSRSQAQRIMHRLVEQGLLSVVANAAGGAPGTSPQYRLHLDRIAAMSDTGRADATGSACATGRMDATGSAHATGSTDAQEGSHGCTGGVAPMRQTGSTDATLSVIKGQGEVKEPVTRADKPAALARPDDVSEQVWHDWCALRLAKKAKVSATAIAGARTQAALVPMTLEQFLTVWCTRGSQGLEASWLKPTERARARPATFKESRHYGTGVTSDGSFTA